MNTITNARDLKVKTDVKALVAETATYKTMYTSVLKRENKLRIKFYDVKTEGTITEIVNKIKALGLGTVEKLAVGTIGLKVKPTWSIVVQVDADKVN